MKVLYLFLLLTLAACTMPAAQPFAALDTPADVTTPTPPPTTHPTQPARPACTVTALEWLNLRSAAGMTAPGVGVLGHGETVTMTGAQVGAWVEVETPAGVVGWIHSYYCKGK